MAKLRTIDTHTHICTLETAALISKAGVKVSITPTDGESAAFDVAGTVYRPFPTGGFDIPRRLKDMDATGVDVHVLSASPQTYLYNVEPELAATVAATPAAATKPAWPSIAGPAEFQNRPLTG